jgi:ribosomal protein L37E
MGKPSKPWSPICRASTISRCGFPRSTERRRTFWAYAKRARLRHLGDVTFVLSKCRLNDGPKQTTILMTNLPEAVTAREIVGVYLHR